MTPTTIARGAERAKSTDAAQPTPEELLEPIRQRQSELAQRAADCETRYRAAYDELTIIVHANHESPERSQGLSTTVARLAAELSAHRRALKEIEAEAAPHEQAIRDREAASAERAKQTACDDAMAAYQRAIDADEAEQWNQFEAIVTFCREQVPALLGARSAAHEHLIGAITHARAMTERAGRQWAPLHHQKDVMAAGGAHLKKAVFGLLAASTEVAKHAPPQLAPVEVSEFEAATV